MNGTFPAHRVGQLTAFLFFLGAVCAAKVPAPITASLDLVSSPTVGASCTVLWSGIARLTPQSAEVVFQVTAPGATAPVSTTQPVAMATGRVAAASFRFTTAAPGVYTVIATARMITAGGRWADAKLLRFEVPAAGPARSLKLQPQSAADYDTAALKREPKAGPRAPSYLTFGPFTVSGTIRYTDKVFSGGQTLGTATQPVRRAKVEIRDKEGSISVLLATATTNDTGFFSYTLPGNNDGDGTGYDVFLRVIAEGAESRITDMSFNKYYYESTVQTDWPGGPLNLGTITLAESASAPWNIYDNILKGSDYMKRLGSTVPKVGVAWARNNDALGTTHYNPPEHRIYLQGIQSDPDEFDDAVILHEYGHHLESTLAYDKNSGMAHGWAEPSDQPTAWSEGWASFFSSVARSSRLYYDSAPGGISILDLEAPTDNPLGQNVEGAVAASLWDIFDQNGDKEDYMWDRMGRIWAIYSQYFNASRACVVRDFYNAWAAWSYPNRGLLEAILNEHGINFGFTLPPLLRSLAINGGAASTASRDVFLNNVCSGSPKYYLASEAANFSGAAWRSWSTAAPFTLSAGNGTKTVYLKVKDAANNVSNIQSDSIVLNETAQAPKLNVFKIDNGAATAYSRNVTLDNTWTGGTPARYMACENSKFTGVNWYPYSAAPTVQLSAGNGVKTIFFKIKTSDNLVSNVMSDTIVLNEAVKPAITAFAINAGVTSSSSRTVTLNNTCTGNPTQYLASESTSFAGASWKTWAAAPAFTIPSGGNGSKTVYFKVRNGAGESLATSANIVLDEFAWLTLGASAVTGAIAAGTDYDLYQFTVTTAGWHTIATDEGTLHDAYMFLYNSAGRRLAEADNQGAYLMPMIAEFLQPGIYQVEVDGNTASDTGNYTISARSGSACLPLSVDGGWVAGDLVWLNDVDWFEFTVNARGTYTIETAKGAVTDALMYLYRIGTVEPLAVNDDLVDYYSTSDGYQYTTMPAISTVLEPGTYRVAVLGWSTADVGAYTIRARSGNANVTCMTLMVNNWPVTGNVTEAGPDNYYLFTIDQKAKYTLISTAGSLSDGQMTLYKLTVDASGNYIETQIAWNGDADPYNANYMPKITATLDKGTYMVWFTGEYSDLGTYSLALKYEDVAAAPLPGHAARRQK